ncbi:MAG: hypothetical protein ACRDST_11015 [Pseudonocardiaceae bacterium]
MGEQQRWTAWGVAGNREDGPMNEETELQQLNQVHREITLDQSMWQIDPVESGRVGLVRSRQIDDYIRADVTVELDDDPSRPRFVVRAIIVDCHDPVRLQTARCASTTEAAEAATAMLRWVLREVYAVAAREPEVP